MADYDYGFYRGVGNWNQGRRLGYGTEYRGRTPRSLTRGHRGIHANEPGYDFEEHIYPYRSYGRDYERARRDIERGTTMPQGRRYAGGRGDFERGIGAGYGREFERGAGIGYGRDFERGRTMRFTTERDQGERGWGERLRHGWNELRGETRETLGMGYDRDFGRRYDRDFERGRPGRRTW